MKKFFTLLTVAAMILSTGCGNQAQQAVNEVKQEAVSDVKEAAADVKEAADKVSQTVDQVAGNAPTANADAKFSLGGISPGMTLDAVKRVLGEPTYVHDADEFTFANGLMVDLNDFGNVDEVKTRQAGVATGANVSVGMTEQNLRDAYGAPTVTENDDGIVEHKYFSGDNRLKLQFDVSNGSIVEIKCSLND